jgi:hypothetical protein
MYVLQNFYSTTSIFQQIPTVPNLVEVCNIVEIRYIHTVVEEVMSE